MAGSFKVDTLLKTFKDLQQEKVCLEKKLRELREDRNRVDSEADQAAKTFLQVGRQSQSRILIRTEDLQWM